MQKSEISVSKDHAASVLIALQAMPAARDGNGQARLPVEKSLQPLATDVIQMFTQPDAITADDQGLTLRYDYPSDRAAYLGFRSTMQSIDPGKLAKSVTSFREARSNYQSCIAGAKNDETRAAECQRRSTPSLGRNS